jgi:hypothetical protein
VTILNASTSHVTVTVTEPTTVYQTINFTVTNTTLLETDTVVVATVTFTQTTVAISPSTSTTTLTTTTITTTTSTFTKPCVIASAAYGSELEGRVQFLREVRDFYVKPTFAGLQFMRVFDVFYYSFSPRLAELMAHNPPTRSAVRALIFPLVASLQAAMSLSLLCAESSQPMIMLAGILASALIGIAYVLPVSILMRGVRLLASRASTPNTARRRPRLGIAPAP